MVRGFFYVWKCRPRYNKAVLFSLSAAVRNERGGSAAIGQSVCKAVWRGGQRSVKAISIVAGKFAPVSGAG